MGAQQEGQLLCMLVDSEIEDSLVLRVGLWQIWAEGFSFDHPYFQDLGDPIFAPVTPASTALKQVCCFSYLSGLYPNGCIPPRLTLF